MVILGIDPGLHISGFGILTQQGSSIKLIEAGYLKMKPTKPLPERILEFRDFFAQKAKIFNVTDLSLETPFLGKNAQNFLKLGYLRGILYLIAQENGLKIHEFSPTEIKQAVTGHGGASKEQVAYMMRTFFPGLQQPDKLDMTDALAVSLCGAWRYKKQITV